MIPDRLAQAERAAFAAMGASPDEGIDAAHRAWLAARDQLAEFVRSSGPVDHHASSSRFVINRHGELSRRPLYRGRFLSWSSSGAASCSR